MCTVYTATYFGSYNIPTAKTNILTSKYRTTTATVATIVFVLLYYYRYVHHVCIYTHNIIVISSYLTDFLRKIGASLDICFSENLRHRAISTYR